MIVARRAAVVARRQGCPWMGFISRFSRTYSSVVVSNVPLDVSASAACVRTNSILQGLARLPSKQMKQHCQAIEENTAETTRNQVYYATSTEIKSNNRSTNTDNNIRTIHLPPNRSDLAQEIFGIENDQADKSLTESQHDSVTGAISNIDAVIFDRFYMEEAHSFRFRKNFPKAAMVLDMQDMHSLRWGRQAIVEESDKHNKQQPANYDPFECLTEVMQYLPTVENVRFLRELASIHRSDLVLVCSPQEMHWLLSIYKVPHEKLVLASFFVEPPTATLPELDVHNPRFVFCGGFKHAPNADAVRILMNYVWPTLRSQLPTATLHIYGAYCPERLLTHNSKNGIFVHGYEPNLQTIFASGILLAPLRFGAGIKGKIVDAWNFGMPVITTPIGSEGMTIDGDEVFGGAVASNLDNFCQKAIELATNPDDYRNAQHTGRHLLEQLFSARKNWSQVEERLLETMDHDILATRRQKDYTQGMLWHQSMRSTEYFSRWVEMKESNLRTEKE